MKIGKIGFGIIILYGVVLMLGSSLQAKLIFHPEKLSRDFNYNLPDNSEEVFLSTKDGEEINALFYYGNKKEVVLYFHGNAGSLNGWKAIAEDFTSLGYNFCIIDYRGYGKSTGTITENGIYEDAKTAYQFLINEKGFTANEVIIYGRSIGTGVAVELASRHLSKGLILESSYTSLKKLANQKVPFLLPSLFLRYQFDNKRKINAIKCPIVFFHGSNDTLIPFTHTKELFEEFKGEKKMVIIQDGGHNDLNDFPLYKETLITVLPEFF